MGGYTSIYTVEELEIYQELTYLSKNEILHCYRRFKQLDDKDTFKGNKNPIVPSWVFLQLPELKNNPFKARIATVFSSQPNGDISFEDFLNLASVFSDKSPDSLKHEYAFRIYDYNGDGYICENDIKRIINCLCGEEKLTEEKIRAIVKHVLDEADFAGDDKFNFQEFEHILTKMPEFKSRFRITF